MPIQDNRLIQFYPPDGIGLGEDDLLLRRLDCIDRLGTLFTLRLDLYSTRNLETDGSTSLTDLMGTAVKVRVNLEDATGGENGVRWFHGIIAEFAQVHSDTSNYFQYEAVVVPEVWLLTQNRDCRIFQAPPNSALDIVTTVLGEHSIPLINSVDASRHRDRKYCVQYRESDFDFISRLLEDEGLYYYFEHLEAGCSMVLCDGPEDHDAYPGYDTVLDGGRPTDDIPGKTVTARSVRHRYHASRYIVTDYDYLAQSNRNPSAVSASQTATYDVVEYPGNFHRPSDQTAQVTDYADLRRKSVETRTQVVAGTSSSTGLVTGSFVKFDSANSAKEYLLIGTHLSVRSNDFESNDAGGDGTYGTVAQTTFEAIDASVRFVPERKTAIPTVQGVQTAIVIGAPGDKGDPPSTDEYGRVRVRFHWDGFGREDASADYKSCWVRVSQMWAGKTWGAMTLPHKGQEVIVDFEEGDPDRPIITGRVYNQATMPYLVPQDNVNRFVLRDLGENRMTMDSTDGRQSIELYSPTATSALTIGHKDVSSTGHADGVDIDPSRPGGTVDDDIQGVKIKTAQHFACVTNKDVIFDVQERWNQRIHGTNQDPTGNRDAPNAWETVINNGDATIKLENGSLNLKVLGGSNGKFDMDVDHNFDLYVKNNYTELTDGDFSSTVGGHGDRLNHSNATSATLGSTNDLFIGEKGSLHIGLDFSAFIGGKVSFVLALEAALNIAGKAEANIGGSIAIDVAKRIEYTIFPKIEKNGTDLKNDLISLKNTTGAALKQAAISMAKSSSLSSYMAPFHMFI